MATYNRAATLPRAMDSILEQTVRDIELIIVDDGSTDSSSNLLKKYATKDSRVKIISQNNQGLASSRNTAVANASSQYIAFMDSDDACSTNRLEVQLNFLVKNSNISACALSNLSPIIDYYPSVLTKTHGEHRNYHGSPFHSNEKFSSLGPHSLITKDSFLAIGGYRTQLTIIEDLDFTLRYSRCHTWATLDGQGLYFYTSPATNPDEGLVNSDVLTFAKRIISCYISEWCHLNNKQDPIEQHESLDKIIAMAQRIPIRDRATIYRNIRYFRHTLSANKSLSSRQSKSHLLGILGDNLVDRWMISLWFKLFK